MKNKAQLLLYSRSLLKPEGIIIVIHQKERASTITTELKSALAFTNYKDHIFSNNFSSCVFIRDKSDCIDNFISFCLGYSSELPDRNICRDIARDIGVQSKDGWLRYDQQMSVLVLETETLHENNSNPKQEKKYFETRTVKQNGAHCQRILGIFRPLHVPLIQDCVKWAKRTKCPLSIVGGGHSGHCLWNNTFAIDMLAFKSICIDKNNQRVTVGAGCNMKDICMELLKQGLAVPLGARPSVGIGLILQGGLGHLSRKFGLSSDSIIGASYVDLYSGNLKSVGVGTDGERDVGIEEEMLWAIRGAGTNFAVIISLVLQAVVAPIYTLRNTTFFLNEELEILSRYSNIIQTLDKSCSADGYLYWGNKNDVHFTVSTFDTCTDGNISLLFMKQLCEKLKPDCSNNQFKVANEELFDRELYMLSYLNPRRIEEKYENTKSNSFKRCLFLRASTCEQNNIHSLLLTLMNSAPNKLSYFHLLHAGGGKVQDVYSKNTAFGCREWDIALVITGVWPKNQDSTLYIDTVNWVYDCTNSLLPFAIGVYSADLGPDLRDVLLTKHAFGKNLNALAELKQKVDQDNILPYACPILTAQKISTRALSISNTNNNNNNNTITGPQLIIMITGERYAGKDYIAKVWGEQIENLFAEHLIPLPYQNTNVVKIVRISDFTKKAYALYSGADFNQLIHDREYKESHRQNLTEFFKVEKAEAVAKGTDIHLEHFLQAVKSCKQKILIIT
eukprot:Pgem_evm2s5769